MLREIEAFLDRYLVSKSGSTEGQAISALRHWEDYVRQKPASQVKPNDIDKFILHQKKHLSLNTLSVYLFYIAKYFCWMERQDLEKHIMKERRKLEAEENAERSIPINHHGVLKMLRVVTQPRDKLLIRLLLWTEIPIGCLENLKVRHIVEEEKYEMPCDGKIIRGVLHSDTPLIIKRIVKEKNLGQDDELVGITERQIQNLIPNYARKVGIQDKVTPLDLREFGKNPLLRNMLIELYEKGHVH